MQSQSSEPCRSSSSQSVASHVADLSTASSPSSLLATPIGITQSENAASVSVGVGVTSLPGSGSEPRLLGGMTFSPSEQVCGQEAAKHWISHPESLSQSVTHAANVFESKCSNGMSSTLLYCLICQSAGCWVTVVIYCW